MAKFLDKIFGKKDKKKNPEATARDQQIAKLESELNEGMNRRAVLAKEIASLSERCKAIAAAGAHHSGRDKEVYLDQFKKVRLELDKKENEFNMLGKRLETVRDSLKAAGVPTIEMEPIDTEAFARMVDEARIRIRQFVEDSEAMETIADEADSLFDELNGGTKSAVDEEFERLGAEALAAESGAPAGRKSTAEASMESEFERMGAAALADEKKAAAGKPLAPDVEAMLQAAESEGTPVLNVQIPPTTVKVSDSQIFGQIPDDKNETEGA